MDSETNIASRIKQYLDSQNISIEAFSEDTEYGVKFDKGRIGKAIKSNAKMGLDVVEKFLRRFPDANPYWLFFAEGEMTINKKLLIFQEKYVNLENSYISTLRDTIGQLENSLKDKEKIINLLENR